MFLRKALVGATAGLIATVATLCLFSEAPTVRACEQQDSGSTEAGKVGSKAKSRCPSPHPDPPGKPAPRRWEYCDDLNAAELPNPDRIYQYVPKGEPLGLYRYPDGREDSQVPRSGYELAAQVEKKRDRKPSPYRTVLVKNGGTPTHQKFRIWCQYSGPYGASVKKVTEVWVSLMTPDALAEWVDLFAEVEKQLEQPKIEFVDSDAESGWLWVQVDHRLGVVSPASVYASATDTDDTGWAKPSSVQAWLRATPVSLTIRVGSDAGEQYLGSCDLVTATNGQGCRMKFTHASSVAEDGKFYGMATLEWTLASNAGILDGLGPLYTNSEFSIEVAEAMAVSRG